MKQKIILLSALYFIFMLCFVFLFIPSFSGATSGLPMIDAYLIDYSKSLENIAQLIHNYGESGREYMLNFFIMDSIYIIISTLLFSCFIFTLTQSKRLSYLPFLSGFFDTIENCIVLYSTSTLNMDYLIFARLFATLKGVVLVIVFLIILRGLFKKFLMKKI